MFKCYSHTLINESRKLNLFLELNFIIQHNCHKHKYLNFFHCFNIIVTQHKSSNFSGHIFNMEIFFGHLFYDFEMLTYLFVCFHLYNEYNNSISKIFFLIWWNVTHTAIHYTINVPLQEIAIKRQRIITCIVSGEIV